MIINNELKSREGGEKREDAHLLAWAWQLHPLTCHRWICCCWWWWCWNQTSWVLIQRRTWNDRSHLHPLRSPSRRSSLMRTRRRLACPRALAPQPLFPTWARQVRPWGPRAWAQSESWNFSSPCAGCPCDPASPRRRRKRRQKRRRREQRWPRRQMISRRTGCFAHPCSCWTTKWRKRKWKRQWQWKRKRRGQQHGWMWRWRAVK